MPMSRASQSSLEEFRITAEAEREAMLHRMEVERCLVTLSTPDGLSFTTLVWGLDMPRGVMSFSGDSTDTTLRSLLESDDVVAVAYLDRIKVQFDVEELVQVKGPQQDVLTRASRKSCSAFSAVRPSAWNRSRSTGHPPPSGIRPCRT